MSTILISVRIPEELLIALDCTAKEQFRSRSKQIQHYITLGLQREYSQGDDHVI